MRIVLTKPPSFPDVPIDSPLETQKDVRWQVICGDLGHWRVGLYSPEFGRKEDITELEQHDCPELFVLLSGRVTLVLSDSRGGLVELPLERDRPVLVRAPHSAFCPDGPFAGTALVVERDQFITEYRAIKDWK